ncbi:hypothetical protein [Membranihabitans marinus]|nr:hypothetical protein [Membranihabitans marinus]
MEEANSTDQINEKIGNYVELTLEDETLSSFEKEVIISSAEVARNTFSL